MTDVLAPLPPWMGDLVEKVFRAKIQSQEPFPVGWSIWIAPSWHYDLRALPYGSAVKVGIQQDGLRVTERGTLGPTMIMGIEVHEDPLGPPNQWRLQEADGSTLAWGEIQP